MSLPTCNTCANTKCRLPNTKVADLYGFDCVEAPVFCIINKDYIPIKRTFKFHQCISKVRISDPNAPVVTLFLNAVKGCK